MKGEKGVRLKNTDFIYHISYFCRVKRGIYE